MNAVVQEIVTGLIVAASLAYVALRTYRTFLAPVKAGCGSCAACPASRPVDGPAHLVTIGSSPSKGRSPAPK